MLEQITAPADYVQEVRHWQIQRAQELHSPAGWLSMVGFSWLQQGAHLVGSGSDNDIVFPAGPARWGVVILERNGDVHFRVNANSDVTIDGKRLGAAALFDDRHYARGASIVRSGTFSFQIIDRGGRKGLRLRDDEAALRRPPLKLEYFPIDESWRVVAKWIPLTPPARMRIEKRLGSVSIVDVPGKAVFELAGCRHELLPYFDKPGGDLFFVLSDQTSGRGTYEGTRFLYASPPANDQVVLDFNRAHNPASAFTPYANCPFAPPANRLMIEVTAGEMRYHEEHEPHPLPALAIPPEHYSSERFSAR